MSDQWKDDAYHLLEELNNNFMLLNKYPYLDEDRSEAREMEARIKKLVAARYAAAEPQGEGGNE